MAADFDPFRGPLAQVHPRVAANGRAQDLCYPSDRLLDTWRTIDQLHLGYLGMEESPEKLDHRLKLEDCIADFLFVASHSQKFCFPETAEVLYRSASTKNDFSGYKAATGWNAIQLYAGNLLSQPWRKEYRQIKMYSGFFKHQIEANLVGAEIMFQAMGYKYSSHETLVLDGPICPDRVSNVSKDCLVAYVECQILKAIWEEVSQVFNISWLEVLEYRMGNVCNLEECVKALVYRHYQKQYYHHHQDHHHRSFSQGCDLLGGGGGGGAGSGGGGSGGRCHQGLPHPTLPSTHSFPPLTGGHSHHHLPSLVQPPPHYLYGNSGGCCSAAATATASSAYSPYAHVTAHNYGYMPVTYPPNYVKTAYNNNNNNSTSTNHNHNIHHNNNNNGYYYNNGFGSAATLPPPQQSHYYSAVPTAQLIEVEAAHAHNGAVASTYDTVDRGSAHQQQRTANRSSPLQLPVLARDSAKARDSSNGGVVDRVQDETTTGGSDDFDNWDYVYRDLASQGYSKDLGERGDLLGGGGRSEERSRERRAIAATKTTNLDEAMRGLTVTDRPLKMTEAVERYDKSKGREKRRVQETERERKRSSQSSSYENLSEPRKTTTSAKSGGVATTTTAAQTATATATPPREKNVLTLASKKVEQQKPSTPAIVPSTVPAPIAPSIVPSSNSNAAAAATTTTAAAKRQHWECKSCTFLNGNTSDICEMCSKSRANVDQRMEIGGAQCAKCTLVNPKDTKICEACGASLKDSPTYI